MIRRSGKRIKVILLSSVLILFFQVYAAFTLEVAKQEIEQQGMPKVDFINYTGPHDVIDTVGEIIGIGQTLAQDSTAFKRSYLDKYTVIHAVDPKTKDLLDADIFIIQENGKVDHIKNLRRILAGYIEKAYGYSQEDALLLAEFITYYNAVYRGNLDYISKKYKQIVVDNLVPEKIGLSKDYKDWPGQTMMLIPLTEQAAAGSGLGSLSSDEVTDQKVIEDLRQKEDKGVEQRKQIVELKEREIVQEEKKIQAEKEKIKQQEESLKTGGSTSTGQSSPGKSPSTEQQQQAQKTASVETKPAGETKTASVETKPAEETKTAAADQSQQQAATTQEQLDKKKEELAKREAEVKKREEQVQKERQQVAQDQQDVLDKQQAEQSQNTAAAVQQKVPQSVLFLKTREENGKILGSLVMIDLETGSVEKQSDTGSIVNRQFYNFNQNYLVVTQDSSEDTGELAVIDKKTLATLGISEKVIYTGTIVYVAGDSIYSIAHHENDWYLVKLNGQLEITNYSYKPVDRNTTVSILGSQLFAQDADGKISVFSVGDLSGP